MEGEELEEAEELLDTPEDEGDPDAASSAAAIGPRPPSTAPWQNFRKPISADVSLSILNPSSFVWGP